MKPESLHVAVEDDLLAKVNELWVRLAIGEQGADIQPQLLENALLDDAVAVEQVGEESIMFNGIQVGFAD